MAAWATPRFHVKPRRRPARRYVAAARDRLLWSTRWATLKLNVTVRRLRPYALTVGGLACFVVSAFTWNVTLGWATAGVCALVFNLGLQDSG